MTVSIWLTELKLQKVYPQLADVGSHPIDGEGALSSTWVRCGVVGVHEEGVVDTGGLQATALHWYEEDTVWYNKLEYLLMLGFS